MPGMSEEFKKPTYIEFSNIAFESIPLLVKEVEKLERALAKCKEQRDDYVEEYCCMRNIKHEIDIENLNKVLDKILKGEE